MFKNILIINSIIITSLVFNSLGLTNSEYELELKSYTNYSFTVPEEKLLQKDFYGNFIKFSIQSSIPSTANNPYEFLQDGERRIARANGQFEINYFLSPIEPNPTNKEFYNCYKGVEAQVVDDRYYSVPVFSNDVFLKSGANNSNPKIESNYYRIIPSFAINLNFQVEEPESNYNFFKVVNNELISITDKADIIAEPFQTCITTTSGKYANYNAEGIDVIFKTVNPEDRNTVHNVIRRSILGAQDNPTIDIDIENRRIKALKNPNPPKNPTNTNNLFLAVFYGIPLIAIVYFAFKLTKKLRSK